MPIRKCKRGHAMTFANTKPGTVTYDAKRGPSTYVTAACRKCLKLIREAKLAGKPYRDMRSPRRVVTPGVA